MREICMSGSQQGVSGDQQLHGCAVTPVQHLQFAPQTRRIKTTFRALAPAEGAPPVGLDASHVLRRPCGFMSG
jgi:hypothetical protein